MTDKDYCVFIITYGRANKVVTLNSLNSAGYATENVYLVCDTSDAQLPIYQKKYKKVLVFDKEDLKNEVDCMDTFNEMRASLYARNKLKDLAIELKKKFYVVLDDDYRSFVYRRPVKGKLKGFKIKTNFEDILLSGFSFMEKAPAVDCFSFMQMGDFIGGVDNFEKINGKRKIMNFYFFRTDTPIEFKGTMNEDVNASLYLGQRGKVLLSFNDIALIQDATQFSDGGITETYKKFGTYIKSFYSVMINPSAVKVGVLNSSNPRIHHSIDWNKAVPKILRGNI